MKKKVLFFLFVIFCQVNIVHAEGAFKNQYETAKFIYAAANACLASYDEKVGNIFYTFLQNDGWHSEHFNMSGKIADANIFYASKYDKETDENIYIVAFRGTDSKKDMSVNKKTTKVFFSGSTINEFKTNSAMKNIKNNMPQVHRGFFEYTMVAFGKESADSSEISEMFLNNSKKRFIITGHSLGGAVATVYASVLIDLGVPKEKITVITFGAPAIGNKAFSEEYKDKINLIRVYSKYDPIPNSLQFIKSDYVQFGTPLSLKLNIRIKTVQHAMDVYADLVAKHYYDSKKTAILANDIAADSMESSENIGEKTVAIFIGHKENVYNIPDYKYMVDFLSEIYRQSFIDYKIVSIKDTPVDINFAREESKKLGVPYTLAVNVSLSRSKETKGEWIVTLEQSLFDVKNNKLLSGGAYSDKIKFGRSFFQASAYNAILALNDLKPLDARLIH